MTRGLLGGICPPLFGKIQGRRCPISPPPRSASAPTAKRTAINTARKTRVRGFIRKVEEAIAKGDKKAALAALKAAEPEIMRGVSKGVLHKNTGAAESFAADQAGRKTAKISERWNPLGIQVKIEARPESGPFLFVSMLIFGKMSRFRHCNTDDLKAK